MVDLEQRIATLEAIEAIKSLKAKYFFACDNKRPEEVRACFADGEVDLRYGRIGDFNAADDMVAVFTELACQEHIIEMHHAQNPQIVVETPDAASATWGLYYYLIDTHQNIATQLGGYYEDRYRRIDGEWKITVSAFHQTSTLILETSEAVARVVFAGRTAPAEIDDPSKQAG